MSIAALVTGILGMALVPLGLGIAGVVRTKEGARSGRGMAIAGIVLGAVSTVAWSAFLALIVFAVNSDEFRESFERGFEQGYDSSQEQAGLRLEPGDCVQLPADLTTQVESVEHVDCAEPHTAEIVGERDITGDTYPGEDEVWRLADEYCYGAAEGYIAPGTDTSGLDVGYFYPTTMNWSFGDRQIDCWVQTLDGSPLNASLAGSAP